MSYMHLVNLYKNQDILLFKRCFSMEKIHGSSAHIAYTDAQTELTFFAGGQSETRFRAIFGSPSDRDILLKKIAALGFSSVIVYGEVYGGGVFKASATYGKEMRFIVFDILVTTESGSRWLNVPKMAQISTDLGLEVVPWEEISTDIEEINRARDKPSDLAIRRGCGNDRKREGVVLRPLVEMTNEYGERVMAKHKQESFSERATEQTVQDPGKLVVLAEATAIADEWVTEMRLSHVLDKIQDVDIRSTSIVIKAMCEDVYREAAGEVVESKEATTAISKKTALMFKERLKSVLESKEKEEANNE